MRPEVVFLAVMLNAIFAVGHTEHPQHWAEGKNALSPPEVNECMAHSLLCVGGLILHRQDLKTTTTTSQTVPVMCPLYCTGVLN